MKNSKYTMVMNHDMGKMGSALQSPGSICPLNWQNDLLLTRAKSLWQKLLGSSTSKEKCPSFLVLKLVKLGNSFKQIKIGWVHVWIELHHYEIKAIFTSPQINDFSDFIRVAEALAVLAPLQMHHFMTRSTEIDFSF